MIYTIGISMTFFLSFILLTKKAKTRADIILFVWLCVIMLQLALFALISSKQHFFYPDLLGIEIPLPLLHGPFLFFYTISQTGGQLVFRKMLIHFIPIFLSFFSIIPFLILGQKEKIHVYQNEGEGFELLSAFILVGIILSGITYTFLSLRTLLKHKRLIKDNFSYTEKINLKWLFQLIIGLSCIWILVFFADDEIIFTAVVLFVLFIGYHGIKQVGIFSDQQVMKLSPDFELNEALQLSDAFSENSKYVKSTLSGEKLESIHGELVNLITKSKLYLTPELTLAMVAQELDVHPNTLSQVINSMEQKNFFDFINTLRIEEFKKRAAQPENQKYTILALAFECGFNSKTSFNRNFKNITGKSPSEYLKESKIMLA